jgi:heat shock protein HslJ
MMAVPLAALVVAMVACGSGSTSRLVGPTWQWTHLAENHPKHQTVVTDPTSYTLTLKSDGAFGARVDCNQLSGTYTTSDSSLTLKPGAMTAVGCGPNSLGARYVDLLAAVSSYSIDGKNMTMQLAHDAGEMGFAQG